MSKFSRIEKIKFEYNFRNYNGQMQRGNEMREEKKKKKFIWDGKPAVLMVRSLSLVARVSLRNRDRNLVSEIITVSG